MQNHKPVKLSPNSLNLFYECPLCFWLDKRMGIRRPQPFPYALNSAVDVLLKQEFDGYRAKGEIHPLLSTSNIPVKLFPNQELLNEWRSNFKGIRYYDPQLDATIFGAVDDVLVQNEKLAPLDYKSTGSAVAKVYDRFQLQLDIYTYLLERNGYETMRKGFLAFYVVDKSIGFQDKLPFRKEIHVIDTDPSYVPEIFAEAATLLRNDKPPAHNPDCEHGKWFSGTKTALKV